MSKARIKADVLALFYAPGTTLLGSISDFGRFGASFAKRSALCCDKQALGVMLRQGRCGKRSANGYPYETAKARQRGDGRF